MTETATVIDPAELQGRTRADLLELCRARGLRATGWKRDRMFLELTGQSEPVTESTVKLTAPAERGLAESGAAARAKSLEERSKRTGACASTTCEIACPAYEEGHKDAFGWMLCTCGHTQWAHSVAT